MITSMLITTTFAAETGLTFEFPEATYGTDVTAKVDLYKGIPTSSSTALATMVQNGTLTVVGTDVGAGCAMPTEPGTYCYHVHGEGTGDYYSVLKLFNITENDIAAGKKNIVLEGGKCAGEGYEPGYKPPLAPDTYKKDNRDSDLMNWPDEVLEHFKIAPQGYQTPAFDGQHAQNEFTSQEEMMAFVQDRSANCDYMYLYSAGKTPNYGFDLPMVLITTTAIPKGATLEQAAAAMTADGKVNIWYQSQIHPNEPAAGEGSLVMIDNFINDPAYKALLDEVNVIVVPRINPDGSYLFTRATYDGFDMNRDHTSLKAAELAQLHTAWRLFMTEVVIDTHEFTYYGYTTNGARMSNADDIQTTPASSLNNDPTLNAMALQMSAAAFEKEKNADVGEGYDPIRVNHYGGTGWTANPPIGRCYFGLFDCLSFLVETRGIGAGKNNFERRVFTQEQAVTAYIEYAAAHAAEIKAAVAAARASLAEQGKTYDESKTYALYQTASGEKVTPYVINSYAYKLDGTQVVLNENRALPLNDTAERSRPRPTAYVIPADHPNIDRILYIFDNQGAEYYKLYPGTAAELQQYYYVGPYTAVSKRTVGFEAGLRDAATTAFPNGAYVIPMDQVAANVIAAICEPDVNDSNGYDGSLVQFGLITYNDETKNYPIYRYTGDNPRETLISECKIILDYPEDVPAADVVVTMFDGVPQWRQKNSAADVEDVIRVFTQPTSATMPKLNVIEPNEDGSYTVNGSHGYCYLVRGKEAGKYYNIIKLFVVSEDDFEAGVKHVPVKTGPSAGTGFESGNNNPLGPNGETAPAGFDQGVQHRVPIEGTDEMEPLMGTDGLKDYKPFTTPAFTEGRAMYQATTQQEMMDFIADYAEDCPYMHVYSAGTTSTYGYDYPLIVYTKKNIPADATMEDAAEILKNGGKPIIWQQAQIHPYEPAAGESALVMIQELCGEYGANILDSVDVVLIPRVNVEGAFLFWRGDASGTDMNRDHMAIATEQIAILHDAYYLFNPHVVIDNHEFFFSEMGNYNNNPEEFKLNDFQITGATSLNDDPEITDITTNIVVDKMHLDLRDYGFRPYHYGITSNNPIGRAYYGLDNAISILIESHGADGALFAFPRRVYGQVIATKSIYETTAKYADRIVNAVTRARAEVIEKGKTYEEDDLLVLKQSASGKVQSPTPLPESVADIYGNIRSIGSNAINLQDTIVRSRPRPTAYIVDASVDWLDDLTYILDHHNAEYFMLDPGTNLSLQQYYYIQKDGSKSCIADLREKERVTFPNGCLMIPMDQEVGTIIGMLMEPDVGDSSSYNGTLFQYGLLKYDEDMNFPLYRYTGNNPRETLISGCKIILDYPEDVPAEDVVVTMFDGVPQWRQKNSAADVEDVIRVFTQPTSATMPKLNVIEPNEDGSYTVNGSHGYCYLVRGKEAGKYYNIIKLFVVSEDDFEAGVKHVPVKTGPSAGTGFESGNNNPLGPNGETAPAGFDQGVQHRVPIEGTDEMEPLMGTDGLKDYKPFTTPAFTEGRAMYQATTQQEMMDFIADYAEDCPYMHVYSAGTTSTYGYDYPLIVYTKKNIPADATMEDAAEILKNGGKPIIWQQAQIHPYEPAAGESALVMIQELCGEYGANILDSVDVVLIPRVNVEGAFLFWRGDASGTDMNRDHMAIATEQIAILHDAYYLFNPHVVIDNHEFFFSEMGNYNNNPEEFKLNDFQITGATSLNDDPEITDITTNIVVDKMHLDLRDYGFRPYHYGITSNNPIGRAYYGLDNAISILIESHGADGALFAFPRRVYGQVIATKSIYETTAKYADRIVNAVTRARAEVIEKGKTYEEDDLLVLKQSASGKVQSPTPLPESVADIYGNIRSIGSNAINLQDTIVRSRPRPTAYIVDASVDWLDDLTYILDHHNAEYFMLEPGTNLSLQQYYYIQKDGSKSCIADLREKERVTFPNGCLMIPMDQEVGTIIGMLMEPDVGDSSSYNGTLFQYGLLKYDEDMNFPLYRYTGNNPRKLLNGDNSGSGTVVEPISSSTTPGTPAQKGFTDVKKADWFYDDVQYVADKGLMMGTSDTKFSPAASISRGMLVTILYRLEGEPAVTGTAPFTDVNAGAYYDKAVNWASKNGIVNGYGNGKFGPEDSVTREQTAAIFYRYAKFKDYDLSADGNSLLKFKDASSVSEYAVPAMQWACGAGLMNGDASGSLLPAKNASRAEVAAILHRFCVKVAK